MIFGFNKQQLKVLLIERYPPEGDCKTCIDYKLPGGFVTLNEDLEDAAHRTLKELTSLEEIFLRPFTFFGRPDRIKKKEDIEYLRVETGHNIRRIVTAAFYSLVNIKEINQELAKSHNARWVDVRMLPELAYDHREIIEQGIDHLQDILRSEPIGFNLLPTKFTIRELQGLYEAVLEREFDNRNFRKKILKSEYLVQLDEKQAGVAHKPASFYRFDYEIYETKKKEHLGFNF